MTVNRTARRPRAESDLIVRAGLLMHEAMLRADRGAAWLEKWWKAQVPRTRVGVALIAVILTALVLNVVELQLARGTLNQIAGGSQVAASRATLVSEAAPADAGKMWSVVKQWQGTGSHDTETFTVNEHWRVDWLFNQTGALGQLQVYIYSADGKLINVAANTTRGGSDTSFWVGPGTYVLKVNATGGDWKLDVQDLH